MRVATLGILGLVFPLVIFSIHLPHVLGAAHSVSPDMSPTSSPAPAHAAYEPVTHAGHCSAEAVIQRLTALLLVAFMLVALVVRWGFGLPPQLGWVERVVPRPPPLRRHALLCVYLN